MVSSLPAKRGNATRTSKSCSRPAMRAISWNDIARSASFRSSTNPSAWETWRAGCGQSSRKPETLDVPRRALRQDPSYGPVTDHLKVDPVDQIRTAHLGGADGSHRLPQRTDVRSERHDAAQHHGDRSERGDLIGSEQAEHPQKQQREAAGDCRLGNQDDLPASLGDLGKLLEPCFDPRNLVARIVLVHQVQDRY